MDFTEFETHAKEFTRLLAEVSNTVSILGYDFSEEVPLRKSILELQRRAASHFAPISHIADLACNRTVCFGDRNAHVDVFNSALTVSDFPGSGIIERAVSEMGRLVVRLRRVCLKHPELPVETLAEQLSAPPVLSDDVAATQNTTVLEGVSQLLAQSDFARNVFIMMRFRETPQHKAIAKAIKTSLADFGLAGYLANDRNFSDDLWENVLTYMHGCKYGVAVFEEIDDRDFNPNISLELGYMYAAGKACLLLKDRRMPRLPTDICGKLYANFDTYKPAATIAVCVRNWVRDIGLSPPDKETA